MADAASAGAPSEPAPVERQVIDTPDAFQAAVAALAAGSGPFGVDAERASGFRYSQRAYLVQVFRRGAGNAYLFDPLGIPDFSPLARVMDGVEWILHAASQDLACLRELGLDPQTVFDTELGARLAGLPRVGLGAVVEDLLGVHLKKEHSAADWSTRPMPDSWLEYAALDVELLPDLRDAVGRLLDEAGKSEIARQEFEAVLHKATPPREDPWRRLAGIHTLRSPRQLAVARELWTARDDYAREIDTAPGRLVPDAALLVAARELPESKKDLAALKEFTGRASRTQLDRWFEAIVRGKETTELPIVRPPSDSLPAPRLWSDKNPDADARFKRARPAVTAVAEQLRLPVENLLTPDYLRRVAWAPPTPATAESVSDALAALGARPWQREAVSAVIAQAFVEPPQPADDAPPSAS